MVSLPLGLAVDHVHEGLEEPGRRRSKTVAEQAKLALQALEAQAETPKKTAVDELKDLTLRAKCSSALRAWFRYFDKDQNYRIDVKEFDKGLKELKFGGGKEECLKLWQDLDDDNSGEISFEEFAPQEAELWNKFRHFAGSIFNGSKDMIFQLKGYYAEINLLDPPNDEVLYEREFCDSLIGFGWQQGEELLLWDAFCSDGQGLAVPCIYFKNLRWVDREVKIFKMKQAAKKKAEKMTGVKQRIIQEAQLALKSFKAFMKKQFGNSFRAWRQALDLDGSMNLQRAELFKAVKALNWKGNCRALWKALDHDFSGITTIEEFDPDTAQVIAHFREWAVSMVENSRKPSDIFELVDRHNRKKLSHAQFQQELEHHGYTKKTKQLIHMLDWQDKKYICDRDLAFLDIWRPPAFLTGTPDPAAAAAFKKQLVTRHGHILKAWRFAMDKDGSNSCNWHEFQEAAKLVRFHGNLAGVWLALDADLSGSISLKEIDEDANDCLVEFKKWADEEFGGVRSAFKVLDADGSGALHFKEFKAACRNYGFPGDCKMLFQCLDQQGEGALQPHEVFFLDKWLLDDPAQYGLPDPEASKDKRRLDPDGDRMLEYFTDTPGPGHYKLPESMAQKDHCPTARYCGAFTMQGRQALYLGHHRHSHVSPAKYSPSLKATARRQPAYTFSRPKSAAPKLSGAHSPASPTVPVSKRRQSRCGPGPGSYDLSATGDGPRFTMRPRRALPLHPHVGPREFFLVES